MAKHSFQLVGAVAVKVLARAAARNAVKAQLQGAGVRLSTYPHAQIMQRANAYLEQHPELWKQALERAEREGMIEPAPTMMEK
jgi:hypothetical protein